MSRISRDEQAATQRIFNHVEDIIGPYYGHKTLSDAQNYVSENKWIMFPEYHITSLREGTVLPVPNIFLSFPEDIVDDGVGGVPEGCIGLTYNNVESMIGLRDILKRTKKSTLFMSILKALGDTWTVEIQHKTKVNFKESTPRYSTHLDFKPSRVSVTDLADGIDDSDHNLLKRGDPHPLDGNPVLWDVTSFCVYKNTGGVCFDPDVKKSFSMFFKVLTIR
jgi:hypothetical protein